MDMRYLSICLLVLGLGFLNFSRAQSFTDPSVIIKDQNGNSNPISVNCDYIFDNNQCITLTAQYPEIKSPTDYSISSIPFNPVGNFSEGDEIVIDRDDKWSNIQKLPFNFCFYGNTFNSIIVGDNGVISFDTEFAGTECPYTIAGSLPDEALIHNAIFGAYHDMTNDSDVFGCTTDCGKISLYTTGTAPFRKAVVNYYKMNHFGCEDVKSTLQIVLYETTNVIEIYIKDKPFTCDIGNEKRALIGISNSEGSQGIAPDGRNTGIWETQNEAWRFSPEGASTTVVRWYDANRKQIGTGNSIQICTKESGSYSAEVTYNTCSTVILKNSVDIIFSPEYPTAKNVVRNECFEGDTPNQIVNFEALIPEAIGSQTGITTTLHTSAQDASSGINPVQGLDKYQMNTLSKTFYLRVQKTENCFDTSTLTINLKRKPVLTEGKPTFICTESASGSELIHLANYNGEIGGYESWMKLEYYNSLENAQAGINPISNLQLSNTITIYAKASNPELPECNSIIPVTFTLLRAISVQPQTIALCDNDINGNEIYDLTSFENTVTEGGNLTFSYYKNQQDAQTGVNPISNPEAYSVQNYTIVYVKIEKEGHCPTLSTITFKFKTSVVGNISDVTCDDGSGTTIVNILPYFEQMKESANITLNGFYSTYQGAVNQDPSQLISDPQNFTVNAPSSIVYVRFTDNSVECNFIRTIEFKIIQRIEKKPTHPICDLNNDGQENFKLTNLNAMYLAGYPSSKITYYATLDDYNSGKNPITEILVKGETIVYVKVDVNTDCSFLYQIKLTLVPFELSKTENISLCDALNNGQELYDLNSLITSLGITNYTNVKFYKTETDAYNETNSISNPSSYTINSENNRIYIRVNNEETCPQIIPVQFTLIESVKVPNLNPIEVCDRDQNNSETVDLTPAISQSGVDLSKVSVEFYISQNGAETQNSNEFIKDITSFSVIRRNTTVYVRFQNISTGCYTVKPLTIIMYPFPTVIKTILSVCDFGNDGRETITLNTLNKQLVSNTNGLTFTYYVTEKDAQNSENPITTYTLTSSANLYVKIASGPDCYLIQKINFEFYIPPAVYNQTIELCDNNVDGQETVNLTLYENLLTGNTSGTHVFSYFTSYDNAYANVQAIADTKNYTLTFPSIIYVRVKDQSDCFSIAELTFKAANLIHAENIVANLCDENSDMQEYVDITSYIREMLTSTEQNLTISYYRTEDGANAKNAQDLITNPTNYSATLAQDFVWVRFDNPDTGCYTVRYLEINLIPLPKLINGRYLVCDTNLDDIFTVDLDELRYVVIFNPEGYSFSYYHTLEDAQNDANKIENHQNYIVNEFTEDIIVKATNEFGCSSIRKVTLYTLDKIPVNSQDIEISNCDNDFDGITSFDLSPVTSSLSGYPKAQFTFYSTVSDAQNQTNPITNITNYNNIQPNTDKVYVRVSSPEYCPSLGIINLKVLPVPVSPLEKELKICPNSTLILEADTGNEQDYYEWSTGEQGYNKHTITIHQAGTYWVTITGTNGCKFTYTTKVTEYDKIIITDLAEGKDYITVIAEGPPHLEYSMDQINWQTDNTFRNLEPGIYTFYVRSTANGCISVEKKGVIFNVTNVITPNGDGYNDSWQLCGLEHFDSQASQIRIFDRYGKEVFSENSSTCFFWDGYYLGRPLPTTSYWYVIKIADGREFTGWIMLKNYDENFR